MIEYILAQNIEETLNDCAALPIQKVYHEAPPAIAQSFERIAHGGATKQTTAGEKTKLASPKGVIATKLGQEICDQNLYSSTSNHQVWGLISFDRLA